MLCLAPPLRTCLHCTWMDLPEAQGSRQHSSLDRQVDGSPETKTRIAFWNVRTMYEMGKLAQVTAEMRRYKLHILGVSKSRWTKSGRQTMTTGETAL